LTRATAALSAPVSGLSLAVFRIALGGLLVLDCWRFVHHDRVYRYWVQPEFHFTYPGFGWITPLPEPWIHAAWLLMGLSALFVMLGLFYRLSIVILTVTFGYFFLLDKAEYLNHFYLVLLFLILMCFLPAHRQLSLDARLRPSVARSHVPYAAIFVLRVQMEIMLVFAGLVKLTPDWLAGEPLGMWLRAQSDDFALGFLFHHDWVILAAAWGTVALHVLGAPLLLWERTRLPVFLVYCVFHSANAIFFNIGIFPWLTIAATTIFFAPDWPRRAARWLLGRFEALPPYVAPPRPAVQAIPASPLSASPDGSRCRSRCPSVRPSSRPTCGGAVTATASPGGCASSTVMPRGVSSSRRTGRSGSSIPRISSRPGRRARCWCGPT
jgi:vitamin K-dependent gamma-carboxylase